jgi:VCBS repeat protein
MLALLVVVPMLAFGPVAAAQESAALFDAPLVTLGAFDRYGLVTDLDQDGFQDAVSWWWTDPDQDTVRLKAWRNDGTGKLVARWTRDVAVSPGSGSVRFLACQLDSDGLTDMCIVAHSTTTVSIRALRSRGLGNPQLMADYSIDQSGTPVSSVRAVVADFTGDGLADLAYSVDGTLRLMEFVPGLPGLTLRSSSTPFGNPFYEVRGLLEIDANGDATPDLLAWKDGNVKLIEVQACQATATQTYPSGILDYKPASGDVDGDGDRDLVLFGLSAYVVARRTGPATWSFEQPVTGGPSEFLRDVDQDGDLDGVCCGSGDPSTPENKVASTFRVSVNDGMGAFAPALETPWLGSDHLAGIADLDHDGDLDVVSGRCILYARGPLTERLHPPLGSVQTERTSVDLDGDSDPDFTVGLRTMKRNLGDGRTADFAGSFPVPPQGTQFVGPGWPGDFDGDGDLDLVVRHFAGSVLLSQRLLTNRGGAAFADGGPAGDSGVDFSPGGWWLAHNPESSLAVDVDGDGDVDLITRAYVGNAWRSLVWSNDGLGHFTAGAGFLDEFVHFVGDLTADGIPDVASSWLAYPGASYGSVGWHRGLGGGVFQARTAVSPVAHQGARFAVEDLDADGDLDLAIAYLFTLTIHWNSGGGAFTPEPVSTITLTNASVAHRVWSTDVDGDGRIDLLVSGSYREPNGLVVLRRKPDNTGWEAPVVHVVHPNDYFEGVPCDVDGDGDEDFVTDRRIRNVARSLPDSGWRRQFGAGTPGTGGLVPTLGASGPFRIGESAELRIRGGLGGATGVLTVSLVHGGQHGPRGWISPTFDQLLTRLPFVLGGTPGSAGTGSWSRAITVPPSFLNQTRRYTVAIDDPAAADGLARANELVISYGP